MTKFLNFNSPAEYNEYMSGVDRKVQNNETLTQQEIDNFCFALPYAEKKKHSFCDNDRFEYLYFHKIDNGQIRPKLTANQIKDYEDFLTEWEDFLSNNQKSERADIYINQEFKYEIKLLKREYKAKEDTDINKQEFEDKKKEILSYNKYIYIKGLEIYPNYTFPIKLVLDNKTIIVDEAILYHSLIRHYGEIIKQTETMQEKSYFTEDVLVEDIYELIIEFLEVLKGNNIKIENVISLRFIYKSKYYQLYTKFVKATKNEYRVNSFYPIEKEEDLQDINANYTQLPLNDKFIFLKKN